MISVNQEILVLLGIAALWLLYLAGRWLYRTLRDIHQRLVEVRDKAAPSAQSQMPPGMEVLLKGLTDVAYQNVQATALLGKSVDSFKDSVFGQRGSNYSDFDTPATNRRSENQEVADLIAEHGLTEEAARGRVREARVYRQGNNG